MGGGLNLRIVSAAFRSFTVRCNEQRSGTALLGVGANGSSPGRSTIQHFVRRRYRETLNTNTDPTPSGNGWSISIQDVVLTPPLCAGCAGSAPRVRSVYEMPVALQTEWTARRSKWQLQSKGFDWKAFRARKCVRPCNWVATGTATENLQRVRPKTVLKSKFGQLDLGCRRSAEGGTMRRLPKRRSQ